jgi:predicted nucleotidyltransferase
VGASLTAPVAELAADLAGLPGVVAVVLGGSRAAGTHRPDSDWDLGLYYVEAVGPLIGSRDVDAIAELLGVEPLAAR